MKSNDEDVSFRYWRTDPRRVGPSAVRKARHLLSQYRRGKKVYSEVGCSGYLKIDVGIRWRLLSKIGVTTGYLCPISLMTAS